MTILEKSEYIITSDIDKNISIRAEVDEIEKCITLKTKNNNNSFHFTKSNPQVLQIVATLLFEASKLLRDE